LNTIPKKELYEIIEALPETEPLAANRYLEFLISQGETEYFSPEDLAEIEEGFAEIRRGETISLDELEKKLGL
jgi:hypothetical protein